MQRRSFRISKTGSLNNLKLITEDINRPSSNEVCIEIKAIGLNFADVFTILGLYRAAPKEKLIPGLEFSGVIIDKGENVTGFELNEKVMGVVRFGAFTTHLNLDYRYVVKLPDRWSFEEGASFIVQALTAYYALITLGNLTKHQNVLIHSAAGGVGIYANRIAKKYSAFTIGTVGSSAKIKLLKSEGYDEIIVRNKNFKNELTEKLNGKKLNLVIDMVGGKFQKNSFDLLTETGRLVAVGLSQFVSHNNRPNYLKLALQFILMPRYHTLKLIESNKSILGFNLIWLYDRVELLKNMLNSIMELNLEKPYIGRVFNFEQLIEAVKLFQSGKTTGKIVVKNY